MRSRVIRRLSLIVLPLLLAYLAVAALAARDAAAAVRRVEGAQQALRGVLHGGALAAVTRDQVAQAGLQLDGAAARLGRDQRLLAPLVPLARALGWLPAIGPPIGEAPDLLALAYDAAAGGAALAHGVDPLLLETGDQAPAAEPAGASPAARLVRALAAGAPALAAGDRRLHRAAVLRAGLHPGRYHGPFRPLRDRLATLDADLPAVLLHADALALLPDAARTLFGFDGPRTYVVLGQDSAELRPTGGFIGSAGLVTFDQGALVYQEYRSSYDLDNPNVPALEPPAPLVRYLGAGAWLLRDANWSPDFPTSARQIERFIGQDLGVPVDGVLGFDNAAVTDLLQALGPLAVPGFSEPVTATTWFDLATRAIFTGPGALVGQLGDYQQAKGTGLSAVLQAVLARAQTAHGRELLAVVDGLRTAALGNHLLLALDDQRPAAWARLAGTDGALFPPPAGDVLAPVEANLGYAKVGPYIGRQLDYEVWLNVAGQRTRAAFSLRYLNTLDQATLADPTQRIGGARWRPEAAQLEPAPGLYLDYLRLYLPAGAVPDAVTGLNEPSLGADGGYAVLAGLLPLAPGAAQTVRLLLPAATGEDAARTYRLTLIKQPGILDVPARITVHLAAGTRATTLPPGARQQGDAVVLETTLTAARTQLSYPIAAGSGP